METLAIVVTALNPVVWWFLKVYFENKIQRDVEHTYNEKLEKFKQELIAEKTKELEKYKSELDTQATESNYRYSLYYKAMSETVINIHKAIVAAHLSIYECIDRSFVNKTEKESILHAGDKQTQFTESIIHGKMYLNPKCESLAWEIHNIMLKLFETYRYFQKLVEETTNMPTMTEEQKALSRDGWRIHCKAKAEETNPQFQKTFNELQIEFKQLLGFKDAKP